MEDRDTSSNCTDCNFWNSCPLQKESLPKSACHLGKPKINPIDKTLEEPECDWWLNAPEYNYCFWNYTYENSDEEGNMPETVQLDLAKMYGCSNTKAHFLLKEALQELAEVLQANGIDVDTFAFVDEHVNLFPNDYNMVDQDTNDKL